MNRNQVEELLKSENHYFRYNAVREFLKTNDSIRDYHFIYNKIDLLKPIDVSELKIAILSSFTLDQIKEILSVELFKFGLHSTIFLGGYNQYQQDILNENS